MAKLPEIIPPMLAMLGKMPRDPRAWGFEFKWDGVRTLLFWDGRRARLQSRNLLDVTHQYGEVLEVGPLLPAGTVLDGEIVALDSHGRVSFSTLQHRMHVASPQQARRLAVDIPAEYMIFDVLYLHGRSVMDQPYRRRRELLASLGLNGDAWHTPPWVEADGERVAAAAMEHGLEGVVAKRREGPYESGRRSGSWTKVKMLLQQEFVIGGYLLGQGMLAGTMGSLLLGYYPSPQSPTGPRAPLVYAGKVGTGFTFARRQELKAMLDAVQSDRNPFDRRPPFGVSLYVEPILVAEVRFMTWTPDGIVRQPVFLGLRDDKPANEVVRESL